MQFFRNHSKLIIALSVLFFYSATFVLATPPGSPYVPGATLDPACAPGDTNCSVTLSAAALDDGIVEIADFSATGTPSSSTYLRGDNTWATISGGSGTVTSVSVVSANGFGGSVATATSTPAITITTNVTGLLKGDGTAVSAAVAGTDYESPLTFSSPLSRSVHTISIADAAADGTTKGAATFTAADFNTSSGLVSLDYTNGQAASGSTKGFLTSADWTTFNGKQGALTLTTTGSSGAATLIGNTLNIPQYAYTFSTGLTNTSGTITANLSTGVSGGQSVVGGTGSGENLTLSSTSNGTKGKIIFGSASAYDQVNDRFGITQTTPTSKLHIVTTGIAATQADANGILLQNSTSATSGVPIQYSPSIVLSGTSYDSVGAASVTSRIILDNRPTSVSGATKPIFSVYGAFGANTPSEYMSLGQSNNTGSGMYLTINGSRILAGNTVTNQIFSGTTSITFINSSLSATLATLTNTGLWSFTPASNAATSGTVNSLSWAGTFAPTSGTGIFNSSVITPTINQTGGANGITRGLYINPTLTAAADFRAIETASADYGNGVAAPIIMIGRNTNATNTAAGSINYLSKAGTNGYVWQDAAGNLRIHTAAPSNANDTAGTVVGAQTSTRDTKQDITDYDDYQNALKMIVDAPLHTFRYIREVEGYGSDSPLAKAHLGFIADEVDPMFMSGNAIDQVSINGLLMGSVKALDIKLNVLPVLEDQSLGSKIAEFLKGIAESGVAIVDRLKTQKVQTQELCVGDDADQVCITKDQLRTILDHEGMASSAISAPGAPIPSEEVQQTQTDEETAGATETVSTPTENQPQAGIPQEPLETVPSAASEISPEIQ